MELSPTYSPNKRILLTKTKSPAMFWSKDLAKVDQITKSTNNLFFASGLAVIYFPQRSGEKEIEGSFSCEDSFCVGREVTGFLDLAPGFWFLDMPECEFLGFSLPSDCTFQDLEARDKEVLAGLPSDLADRLHFRRVSILGETEKGGLGRGSVELQYFFGWT